jgi:hypothetical protein
MHNLSQNDVGREKVQVIDQYTNAIQDTIKSGVKPELSDTPSKEVYG